MPEEEKEEPKVPPVAPIVIEVVGDAEVTAETPGVHVIRKD